MNKIPFSLYDFFGYLAAGFMWLVGLMVISGSDKPEIESINWIEGVVWLIVMYVAGHVNAHFANWLLEKKIIGALGYPSINLFTEPKKPHKMFKEFRRILPSPLRENILSRYKKMSGDDKPGEAMYLYCFHTVKERCKQTTDRLQSFMNLYGFSRNMSFALLVVGVLFVVKGCIETEYINTWELPYLGIGFILASVVLFLRMLKFFKHYSIEVFATFGTMKE
jgi:hypothetical protein